MSRPRPLAVIVVLALAIRIVVVLATPHFVPVTDAGEFDQIAVTLAHTGSYPGSSVAPHGGPTAFRPPLFPVALAAVDKVVGTGDARTRWVAGRVLEAVLGALAVALLGLIGTRLWGRRVGLVAAGLGALSPPLVLVGSSLLSESLFIPLVLAAVEAALVYREDPRLRWALGAGVLTGLSALTRGNGFLLVVPIGLLVWTGRPRRSRAALKAPAAVLAATILVLAPWTVRNLELFHRFIPVSTETGYALVGTYNRVAQDDRRFPALWLAPRAQMASDFAAHPGASEAQVSSDLSRRAVSYIRAHPGSIARTVYWNTLRLLNLTGPLVERVFAGGEGYPVWLAVLSVYAFWVLLALALPAISRRPLRAAPLALRAAPLALRAAPLALRAAPLALRAAPLALRAAPLALWGVPLAIYLSTAPLLGLTRYRSPADPFLILLAAVSLVGLRDRIAHARARRGERAGAAERPRSSIGAR